MPAAAAGRTLSVKRPWPTARQESERIIRLAGYLFLGQGVLTGVGFVATGWRMVAVWVVFGASGMAGTLRIEGYMSRKRNEV